MTLKTAIVAAIVLGIAAGSGLARADAIEGPPPCPPGARGRSSHNGQWCVPWECTAAADCGAGHECRPWRVCTRTSDVVPGGLRAEPPPPVVMELVIGTCEPARACRGDEEPPPPLIGTMRPGPATCRDGSHCVPVALPDLPPRPVGGSGTSTGTGTATGTSGTGGAGTPGAASTGHGCGCGVPSTGAIGSTLGIVVAIGILALARRRGR